MAGLTFDTGALIALERNSQRMNTVLAAAREASVRITVPATVIAEWWRGGGQFRSRKILEAVDIEPLHASLALAAGEGLAVVRRSSTIDATVMASADARGDIVYTSDLADLRALHGHFQNVDRILKA